jgi:hypothetical protein
VGVWLTLYVLLAIKLTVSIRFVHIVEVALAHTCSGQAHHATRVFNPE